MNSRLVAVGVALMLLATYLFWTHDSAFGLIALVIGLIGTGMGLESRSAEDQGTLA